MPERTMVNIGVIGVGAFMARQHLPNMLANPHIRIRALCDTNADLLRQRVDEFNPDIATTDAADIFSDAQIDAVMVGTRSEMHAPLLLQAAASEKAIFVEKPLTRTFAETSAVLEAVRRSGITVGVGFNRRFAPAMLAAKNLYGQHCRAPANVVYRIVDDHRIRPSYIFDMADGGGHLLQEACHIFDLLAWFLGEEPVEIYATGPLETDNIVTVKYEGGSLATILCGGKGGFFYPKELMEVFASHTTLAIDQFYELRVDGPAGARRTVFPLDPKSEATVAEPSMSGFYDAMAKLRPTHDVTDIVEGNRLHTIKVDKGHAASIAEFAACLTEKRPYPADAYAGARATLCALYAYESIKANRPIRFSMT